MQLNKVHRQNRNKMSEDRRRKLKANHQHFNNWIYFFYFFIIFFNSLKFGFSLFCWVLHVAYFFLPVFTSCSFVFFVFFSQQLLTIEKRLAIIFDRQQISLKRPIMQLNKVHHGKCRRQNRNKMDEDRRRKLTANHLHFNNWIKQLVGLEWKEVYLTVFPFWTVLSSL